MAPAQNENEEIRTWDMDKIVESALKNQEELNNLLQLLSSSDRGSQMRTLTAILDVVRKANWKTRRYILRESLEDILRAIESNDMMVSKKALKVLGALLKNNPLGDDETSRVISTILKRSRNPSPTIWEELLKIATTLRIPYVSGKSTAKLTRAAFSGTPEEAVMASLILLSSGAVKREEWGKLVERISEIIGSNDPLLVEAGLEAVKYLTKLPPVFPIGVAIKTIVPTLRKIISFTDDQFIKMKAIDAFDRMRDTIVRYYRVRPDEARKTAEELLRLGLIEEAYMITSATGFILSFGLPQSNHKL